MVDVEQVASGTYSRQCNRRQGCVNSIDFATAERLFTSVQGLIKFEKVLETLLPNACKPVIKRGN